jgi:biopolymer transport protein ExbD
MVGKLIQRPDRYRLAQNSDINVTPFVDVMLVLLIIFMVALPAATVSLKLDLPKAQRGDALVKPVYVSLQGGGGLFIGDRPTSLSTLAADLARAIGGANPQAQRVYVRADRSVRYGDFVRVVNQLQLSGFHAVGLVNEEI